MLTITPRESIGRAEKPTTLMRGQSSRLPWAWTGLCFGVTMLDVSREGFRDIVNNLAPTSILGVQTWTRDNRGNAALGFNISGSLGWSDNAVHDRPTTALTAYVRVRSTAGAQVDAGILYNPYGSSAPWSTWGIQSGPSDANTLYGSLSVNTSTESTTGVTGTISTNQWFSVFLRWRSGDYITMTVLDERGTTLYNVLSSGTVSGSLAYNPGQGIYINRNGGISDIGYAGTYSQALVWDRRLTDTELTALVADPFGWYSPRRESIGISGPYPLFGGGSFLREVSTG